jgi:hypothetical protein
MAFEPVVGWTSNGVKSRQWYVANAEPPFRSADEAAIFIDRLRAVVRGWAFVTMATIRPPETVPGSSEVSYSYNGTVSRAVDWWVWVKDWTPTGATVNIMSISDPSWGEQSQEGQPAAPAEGALTR